jgi:hypothetical protein
MARIRKYEERDLGILNSLPHVNSMKKNRQAYAIGAQFLENSETNFKHGLFLGFCQKLEVVIN